MKPIRSKFEFLAGIRLPTGAGLGKLAQSDANGDISWGNALASTYAQEVLVDSPSGYWRIGERGGTIAYDKTGNANGTYMGGVLLAQLGALVEDPDTAALFDGVDDYMAVSDAVPVGASFTYEVWAKSVSTDWNAYGYLGGYSGNNGFVMHPNISGKSITFYIRDSTGAAPVSVTHTPASIVDWHYYAFSYNNTSGAYAFYFDGSAVSSGTTTAGLRAADTIPLEIGRDYGYGSGRNGNAYIDEVALYPTALAAGRIAARWAAATNPTTARKSIGA